MSGALCLFLCDRSLAGCVSLALRAAGLSPSLYSDSAGPDCPQTTCIFCKREVDQRSCDNACPSCGRSFSDAPIPLDVPHDWDSLVWSLDVFDLTGDLIFENLLGAQTGYPSPYVTLWAKNKSAQAGSQSSWNSRLVGNLDRIVCASGAKMQPEFARFWPRPFTHLYVVPEASAADLIDQFSQAFPERCRLEFAGHRRVDEFQTTPDDPYPRHPANGFEIYLGPCVSSSTGTLATYVAAWVDENYPDRDRVLQTVARMVEPAGATLIDPVWHDNKRSLRRVPFDGVLPAPVGLYLFGIGFSYLAYFLGAGPERLVLSLSGISFYLFSVLAVALLDNVSEKSRTARFWIGRVFMTLLPISPLLANLVRHYCERG